MLKKIDKNIKNVPTVVTTCCILHNICEFHKESFNEAWLEEVDNTNQPSSPANTTVNDAARNIRDTLVSYYQ